MNRISTQPEGVAESVETGINFRVGAAEAVASRRSFPYSVFVPMHYEKNYSYPLIIWLHANGHNERQLTNVMQLVSMRNYVGMAPRGIAPAGGTNRMGFDWPNDESSILTAEYRAYECIEYAQQRFNIHSQRIFLAGYEAGGSLALRLALRNPNSFAGAITIGGPFPRGHMPLMHLDAARNLPLLISHGRDAQNYSIDQSCHDLRLFHSAGLSVSLRQYPCGDEMTTNMLSDMDAWLMEQITGTPMCEEQTISLPPEEAN